MGRINGGNKKAGMVPAFFLSFLPLPARFKTRLPIPPYYPTLRPTLRPLFALYSPFILLNIFIIAM
jgi:hypothetical protein